MKVITEKISPKKAGEMLKGNTHNRNINGHHVDRLAAAMLSGEWKLNGDAIRFNGSNLIDGQHRLQAIIKSGKTIQTLVIYDLPEDVFDTIDIGKVRSGANTLEAAGEKNSTTVACALRMLKAILTGNPDSKDKVTNVEIMQGLGQHPDIRRSAQVVMSKQVARVLGRVSILTALHYLFAKKDSMLADLFVAALDDGSGLMSNDPIYHLRQKLLQNKLSPAKLSNGRIAHLIVKSWNSVRTGEKVKLLRVTSDEAFPVIR